MKSFQLILHFSILNFILWLREVDLLMNVLQLVHMQAHVYKSNYPNHISHPVLSYICICIFTIFDDTTIESNERWWNMILAWYDDICLPILLFLCTLQNMVWFRLLGNLSLMNHGCTAVTARELKQSLETKQLNKNNNNNNATKQQRSREKNGPDENYYSTLLIKSCSDIHICTE